MKKYLAVTAGLLLSASFAWGVLGEVVASFPAPADFPIGLARANNATFLFVYCNTSPYCVFQVDSRNGSVYSSFESPQGHATCGLTYSYGGGGGLPEGSYLWMGNVDTRHIYRCNYSTGSVYASFPAYTTTINGLAVKAIDSGGYCPTHMLSSNRDLDQVYYKDLLTGSNYGFFTPTHEVYDLAWDYKNQIIWAGGVTDVVYGYNAIGSLVASFTVPAVAPVGLTYYPSYLWVGTTVGSHYIWKVHCPYDPELNPDPPDIDSNVNIEPESMGKIKAMYR
ncbi:MAG: hypothetical protein PVH29_10895 [Candidatus Zixiibacteriota bacterium]|jgi:hypothetical protein